MGAGKSKDKNLKAVDPDAKLGSDKDEQSQGANSIRESMLNVTPNSAGGSASSSRRQKEQKQVDNVLEQLPNYKLSCCKDQAENKKKPIIDLFSILNPRLQHIYNRELEDMLKSFKDQEKQMTPIEFKYEVMICFWFSIHIEYVEAANILYELDEIIEQIMKNFRSPYAKKLIEQHKDNNKKKRRKDATAMSVTPDHSASNMDRSKEIVQEEDLLGDNNDEDVEEDVFANPDKKGEEIFGKMNLHNI